MIRKLKITVLGETYDVTVEDVSDPADTPAESSVGSDAAKPAPIYAEPKPVIEVKSQLSGIVSGIAVNVGDEVHSGDGLCTIEMLKMQNTIPSPIDGVVTGLLVGVGDSVEPGALLITLE